MVEKKSGMRQREKQKKQIAGAESIRIQKKSARLFENPAEFVIYMIPNI